VTCKCKELLSPINSAYCERSVAVKLLSSPAQLGCASSVVALQYNKQLTILAVQQEYIQSLRFDPGQWCESDWGVLSRPMFTTFDGREVYAVLALSWLNPCSLALKHTGRQRVLLAELPH
jgi:hypothetical protein